MQNINAFESLRASDFDCYSAYGEIIDNSIQANATKIFLQFNEKKERNRYTNEVGEVFFADNGIGMNRELLNKCLSFGESSRFNDRSGIGRFGVGMILAAIHECKRIEVYSKQDYEWYFTYLDLDEIKQQQQEEIPEPIIKDPNVNICYSPFLEFLKDSPSGTFIIWKKYDRYTDKFNIVLEESKFYFGRTFRKFIWGTVPNYSPIELNVNGEIVKAIDPLYLNKNKTGFENEPIGVLMEPQNIEWPIPLDIYSDKTISKIKIDVSILPESYLQQRGEGNNKFAKNRFIDRNEGISILRNYREVFFGHLPHAQKLNGDEADRNVSRFIGCEISFMPELDTAFEVKNIKRGCVPGKKLKDVIIEKLSPTFRQARQKIRDHWDNLDRSSSSNIVSEENNIGLNTGHSETNRLLRNYKELTKNSSLGKTEDDNVRIASILKDGNSENNEVIKKLIEYLKDQGFTVLEKSLAGTIFISFEHGNGLKTMIYNTNSPYYASYKRILEGIEHQSNEISKKYKVLIDFIFVGYMMAEAAIDPNEQLYGFEFIENIKSSWANQLNKFFTRVWID